MFRALWELVTVTGLGLQHLFDQGDAFYTLIARA